jgi:predicted porin
MGLTASAEAGDAVLPDPIPDNLTWRGVTVYGTIDLGYAYQTHGVPLGGSFYPGLEYTINGSRNANKPISSIAESALEQSKAGIRIEEKIAEGWKFIGKAEAAFQPLSGEIADACASMAANNGKPLTAQSANSDGSRCGQAFSGPAFAGLSNATYGTLTLGRNQSLERDAIGVYDPMGLPYAFSLIGYSGGTAAGFGNTETGRWDNSAKYVYQYGPVHAAALYTAGGQDTAMFGGGYSFNAGAAYNGFSVDAVYAKERSAVSSTPIAYGTAGAKGTCDATLGSLHPCPQGNLLDGVVTDGEGWSVMGKYTYEMGGGKDPASKLSVFAGYVHTQLSNPSVAVSDSATTIGGYGYTYLNKAPYAAGSNRVLQTVWTGAKYELPSGLSFTAAYYRYSQDAYLNSSTGTTCAYITAINAANKAQGLFWGFPVAANCAGEVNEGAFLIDYPLNKHFDVYSGVSYSVNAGGLSSGYLNNNMTTFASGFRLRF